MPLWLLVLIGIIIVIVVFAFIAMINSFHFPVFTILGIAILAFAVFVFFVDPGWITDKIRDLGDENTVTATVDTPSNSLTEAQIREIVRDEAGDLQMSIDQLEAKIDGWMDEVNNQPSLTEDELRKIIRSELNEMRNAVQRQNSSSNSNGSNGGPCRLDGKGPWSEGNNTHRIEVGGHGPQHFDFYPQKGVKAVSYVVNPIADPSGVPDIAFGYGSMWEGDSPECVGFDYVADATKYARARLDSGHSGLVVEWGTWKVLANVNNMTDQQIQDLLNTHKGKMGNSKTAQPSSQQSSSQQQQSSQQAVVVPTTASVQSQAYNPPAPQTQQRAYSPPATTYVAPAPPAPAPPPAPDCTSTGGRKDPVVGVSWDLPAGGWIVVNIWSNQNDPNLSSHKMFLGPSDQRSFVGGGGDYTQWPDACQHAAQQGFDNNGNPAISVGDYNAYVQGGSAPAQPAAPAAPAGGDCTAAEEPALERSSVDVVYTVTGPVMAEVWSPVENNGNPYKVPIAEGETKTFTGHSVKVWRFPSGCEPS